MKRFERDSGRPAGARKHCNELGAVLLAVLCLASLGASCDGGGQRASQANPDPRVQDGDGERVDSIEGVDISELTDSEVEMWTALVNERLSPCGEPVSVARCAADKGRCGACVTAARYITRLVMEGYDKPTIEEHFKGRFDAAGKREFSMDGGHVRGAPMARVSIVEFSDFQCPYCGQAHPELKRILSEFDGKVNLLFKHYPLPSHSRAEPAARAAEAAGRQGKFWEMHDLLFDHQRQLEDVDLRGYAQTLGLDAERFAKDLEDPEVAAKVEADRKEGEAADIKGTPSIFINGRPFNEPLKMLPRYLAEELDL
ncbi:MAG: DsbA family protein [Myxococcales bacterium]|nr:DsbA family protein [Myxococcales bacterium]